MCASLRWLVCAEDIVKTYSLVEQEIDGLRSKLHDKVVAWRKTVMTAPVSHKLCMFHTTDRHKA